MKRRSCLRVSSVCALISLAGVGCDDGGRPRMVSESVTRTLAEWVAVPVFGDDVTGRSLEIVFQSIQVRDGGGELVSEDQKGTLTLEVWQRAARPWTHTSEPYVYHEQAWEK